MFKPFKDIFKGKSNAAASNVSLPIPRHMREILKPLGNDNQELHVTGEIECECGCRSFKIRLVGDTSSYQKEHVIKVAEIKGQYFLIVKVQCNKCNKENLIFDNDFHGWNGFICGGDAKQQPRPEAQVWYCNKCNKSDHLLKVSIQSQGQEDFIEEAGDEFDKNDWAEAFGWITIMTRCNSCGESNDKWITYETM